MIELRGNKYYENLWLTWHLLDSLKLRSRVRLKWLSEVETRNRFREFWKSVLWFGSVSKTTRDRILGPYWMQNIYNGCERLVNSLNSHSGHNFLVLVEMLKWLYPVVIWYGIVENYAHSKNYDRIYPQHIQRPLSTQLFQLWKFLS